MLQHFIGNWVELLGWAAMLALVAGLAGLIVRVEARLAARTGRRRAGGNGRRRSARPVGQRRKAVQRAGLAEMPAGPEMPARLDRRREWELVVRHGVEDLARGQRIAALQEDATLKLLSAEHALNRLAADCARLRHASAAPAFELPSRAEHRPDSAAERRPLAA
jgi:hypothetical protein